MPAWTRWVLLAAAIAMPVVSYLTQAGALGGRVGDESDRFATLIVPAGYAFAIWGLIFLLDLVFAGWQASSDRATDRPLAALRPWAAACFALTAAWTPVFGQQAWLAAVVIIWLALASALRAAWLAAQADRGSAAASLVARVPLALHAGWLSLAAFANTAQLALAMGWTSESTQWPTSAGLWLGAAALIGVAQRALATAPACLLAYTAAAVWGLVGVLVEQRSSALPGAQESATVAMALIALLCLHSAWLLRGKMGGSASEPAGKPSRR